MVRLHRLLRQCEVQQVIAAYTTMLPPSNSSMHAAAVVTVKNVGHPKQAGTSTTTASVPPSVPLALMSAPVRVARLTAVHDPQWVVECPYTRGVAANGGNVEEVLYHGGSLTLPLTVARVPRVRAVVEAEQHYHCAQVSATPTLVDSNCLELKRALPSAALAAQVEEKVGTGITTSSENLYFLQSSCQGAGSVGKGAAEEDSSGGLAFYADKGGTNAGRPLRSEDLARMHSELEQHIFGDSLEQFMPIAVSITWVLEGQAAPQEAGGGGERGKGSEEALQLSSPQPQQHAGQLFIFVDAMEYVYRSYAEQQLQRLEEEEVVALTKSPTTTAAQVACEAPGGASISVEEVQRSLCEALFVSHTGLNPLQGALVYQVSAPISATSTEALRTAAEVQLRVQCLSLAPIPLVVSVASADPSSSAANGSACIPMMLVGKTSVTFLLRPSEQYTLHFTAHLMESGLVNCNQFTVSAFPICFPQPTTDVESHATTGTTE